VVADAFAAVREPMRVTAMEQNRILFLDTVILAFCELTQAVEHVSADPPKRECAEAAL
jgi:hypothetical protein